MQCNLLSFWPRLTQRRAAPAPGPRDPQIELSQLETIDRDTSWPTHRIRWYLQTQVQSSAHRN
ncbi:MAG: hypothetical protein KGN16_13245 [Burkholderiales bacterium]|nr:hypothetical protein [Burkholderiales bacterium]